MSKQKTGVKGWNSFIIISWFLQPFQSSINQCHLFPKLHFFKTFFELWKTWCDYLKGLSFFFQAKVEIFLYDGVIKISFGWANLHDGDSFMWVIKVFFQWTLWLFFVVCIAFELLSYFSPCLYVEKRFFKKYYNSKGYVLL